MSPTAWLGLIYALVGRKLYDDAFKKAEMALRNCPTCPGLWFEMARVRLLRGEFLEADSTLAIAYELKPETLDLALAERD